MRGVLAVRFWKIGSEYKLTSTNASYEWEKAEVKVDKPIEIGGNTGFYSFLPSSVEERKATVMGVVELRGTIFIDTNGVCRSEYCRIVELFLSVKTPSQPFDAAPYSTFIISSLLLNSTETIQIDDKTIQSLHARYGVPMIKTDDLAKTWEKWKLSHAELLARNEAKIQQLGKTPDEVYMPPCVTVEHYNPPPPAKTVTMAVNTQPYTIRIPSMTTSFDTPCFDNVSLSMLAPDTGLTKLLKRCKIKK